MKNLEKGTYLKNSFAYEDNVVLLSKARCVNISLGIDTLAANKNIDGLKEKELEDRKSFEDKNPEVNLPNNLDSVFVIEEFPPLTSNDATPTREKIDETDTSWVQVASKGKVSKLKIRGR